MPTVTFNRKTFDRIIGKKIDDDLLKDRISYVGTDLEKADDGEIVVEVFPNRPDMLSEYGFARALSSFMGIQKGLRKYDVAKSGARVTVTRNVAKVRPYTVCAIVKNLKLDDEKIKEIIQIQEKLHVTFCRNRKKAAIGIYPLEKIAMPITYTAMNPEDIVFQPLDSSEKMNAREILEKHPTGREYGRLLEGQKTYTVFLDSNNEVLSVPPIINSEKTGRITEATREAFIECSGFDLVTLNYLLNIISASLLDMGAEIQSMEVAYPDKTIVTPDMAPWEMKIDYPYINKWLGLDLSERQVADYLAAMGYGHKPGHALVPSYRADVLHTVDLAEDIAIAYGYENFKGEIPKVATIAEESPFSKFQEKVARIMIGAGCQEVNTYHLSSQKEQCTMMNCRVDVIALANSFSEDYNVLRAWIMPCLLKILADNKTREFPQKIYDYGIIFKANPSTETGTEENVRLASVISHSKADFSEAKQQLGYLLSLLGLPYEIEEEEHPSFIPGRVGRVKVKGKKVAYIGELHPIVLQNFGIEMPVSGFEINLTEIFGLI